METNWLIIVYDDVGHVKVRHSATHITKEAADELGAQLCKQHDGASFVVQTAH